MPVAPILIAASAAIILALGCIHLLYTFTGNKLTPRESELEGRMKQVSPQISRETTMWKTWVGFNASHAGGAILFGLLYGYFALWHHDFLRNSVFLSGLGATWLVAYCVLGKRYWFSVPFRGIALATALYVAGLIVASLA